MTSQTNEQAFEAAIEKQWPVLSGATNYEQMIHGFQSVVDAIKEIKPDWWMSGTNLKLWVARANGLLG